MSNINQQQSCINTKNIRNMCILAHVDHGKTTLADALLAHNGIISNRMSGKLRYMDSRQDEQERGITMKSSAISLIHRKNDENWIINLIDSPGHVDFSTEVSTAVRLCDGAVILIDVAEGICPQTHAVLRQASLENLKLILVLNKIDRLILELKMTPLEAYNHLLNILEQFNAIVAQQFTNLLLEKNDKMSEIESDENIFVEWDDKVDESKLYFSPKYNNVFFASAVDGWGFGLNNFADIYATKLGFRHEILMQTLWGDYYLNVKTKRIMKNAQRNSKKPLFVQFVLDSIWQVYDALFTRRDTVMTEKILNSLNIKLQPRDLKYTEAKGPLKSLFINWLPLGKNLLDMVVDLLPSPLDITSEKVEHLICARLKSFKHLPRQTQDLKNDFMNCQADESKPVIVFISKMFAAEKDTISKKQPLTHEEIEQKREAIRMKKHEAQDESQVETVTKTSEESKQDSDEAKISEEKHEFLAFARVFSGTLKKGQTLFILSPKHNPEDFINYENINVNSSLEEIQAISKNVTKFTVNELYLMMGRELEPINQVPCGNIVAIGGLENLILKSATLSTTIFCPSFTGMHLQTSPIVRVAIEPKNPSKMKDLVKGLKLLNQSDPCVEIMVQENGEHILCTAGEVHLQRCIDDLVQRFALVEVNVSAPIIPFKETIVSPPKFDQVKEKIKTTDTSLPATNIDQSKSPQSFQANKDQSVVGPRGEIELQSNDKRLSISIRARPLPLDVVKFLDDNVHLIKLINNKQKQQQASTFQDNLKLIEEFRQNLSKEFSKISKDNDKKKSDDDEDEDWSSITNRILAWGPNRCGPNILVNNVTDYSSIWSMLNQSTVSQQQNDKCKQDELIKEFENSFLFGFNLATAKGPLCEEPMQGVAFFIERFNVTNDKDEEDKRVKSEEESLENIIDKLDISDGNEQNDKFEYKIKRTQNTLTSTCVTLTKEACRKAFEAQPQRLMAAMYKCETMTVNSEALGKLYAVLGKRNAKIIDESIKDSTNIFCITAYIPVADSFGLAEEIRKRTSGLASPHLEFSHFETIDIDPFWEPKTEEELSLYGDKADFENQAKKYVNDVRKRKGLFVREKLVEHAEKQRTLMK